MSLFKSKPHIALSSTSGPEGQKTVVHGKVVKDTTKGGKNTKGGKKNGK